MQSSDLEVESVIISDPETVLRIFTKITGKLKPRHQRDITHLESLIKGVALLNAWKRLDVQNNVITTKGDIEQAVELWKSISASQELGIPPYVLNFYHSFIVPAYKKKYDGTNLVGETALKGVTRAQVCQMHFELAGQMPSEDSLRKNIIPTLDAAGLIGQAQDPGNKRQWLIYPLDPSLDQYSGNDTTVGT